MNRLFYSSYETLEAAINLFSHDTDEPCRKLFHFSRERNGSWVIRNMITDKAASGGSMIESMTNRHENQEHGDFELLVLEEGEAGVLGHYTRINTVVEPQVNGDSPGIGPGYRWQRSAFIEAKDMACTHCPSKLVVSFKLIYRTRSALFKPPSRPEINLLSSLSSIFAAFGLALLTSTLVLVIDAAPLVHSRLPMGRGNDGTTLETVVLDAEMKLTHYRCPQHAWRRGQNDRSHVWFARDDIVGPGQALGAAYLHQDTPTTLMVAVPTFRGIEEHRFRSNKWEFITVISRYPGPCCIYTNPPLEKEALYVLATTAEGVICLEKDRYSPEPRWIGSLLDLPGALQYFLANTWEPSRAIPFSVVSNPDVHNNPEVELIAFHPSGDGDDNVWMILHWKFILPSQKWVVSSVVLQFIYGMPY
ncbi:hypothetical protein O1611_g2864 [Lasiodiplodia mahajangana]|uniref:Uncharacterized protein n=1 Tax=Lasiodiplodia mahajangana TaxID=1108764 RepID=A0ACC2JTV9_9PEZI|nr:hypothetical protein O1611_g2864 [Lasiodiplodia mahajangana]